ncbi:hypothetical protein SKAU_G00087650 [Synaphobranchus kaupii]|uniref:Uncharacterized protein n=1 Tax=Synaphobranchus kaupii TaxID=118154 RepID=A0A9Q1FWH0_SYNKA|nr:hypothetical protein SKAU_G00087650 [Synaphobranchus kaupii]
MPDTRASSRASPDANAALDLSPGQDAILQVITELRPELLTKAEAQSAEIRNQVDQLRAELKLANDDANAKSEALDKQVVALESAANSHSDSIVALERDMAKEKEAILRKSRQMKQLTTGDGDKIRVQPDYTQAVAKRRAEFNEVRGLLRTCEGIR